MPAGDRLLGRAAVLLSASLAACCLCHRTLQVAGLRMMASSSTGPCRRVFALDFDGVICNSVGESSQSAYRYLQKNEPQILVGTGWENQCPPWLIHKMRKLRPVVETGYENILLARLLIEEQKLDLDEFKSEQGTRPLQAGELISNWGPDLRDTVQLRYGYTKEQLVSAFGKERDDWMRDDMASWLNANTFYEGVPDAVKSCMGDAYIITTKQQRFACALLEHAGLGKEFPPEKVFGLGSGPKADVLDSLASKLPEGGQLYFFEDRVETLQAVCADQRLNRVRLYLVDWGYNTSDQRELAESIGRIEVIDVPRFRQILTTGA